MMYWAAWAASDPFSALLPGPWGCAGAEGAGGSTLIYSRQRLLLCSLQNSHGDSVWHGSEVHLHTQSGAPLNLLLSLQNFLYASGLIITQIE